jgi:hypothetical protein
MTGQAGAAQHIAHDDMNSGAGQSHQQAGNVATGDAFQSRACGHLAMDFSDKVMIGRADNEIKHARAAQLQEEDWFRNGGHAPQTYINELNAAGAKGHVQAEVRVRCGERVGRCAVWLKLADAACACLTAMESTLDLGLSVQKSSDVHVLAEAVLPDAALLQPAPSLAERACAWQAH